MADEQNQLEGPQVVEAELAKVAQAADDVSAATAAAAKSAGARSLDFIMDVVLQVTVEVGRARMTIQDLLQLGQGSVIELEKLAGESLDIYVNGQHMAKGEAVIVNEKFGVRILEIVSPEARVRTFCME